MTVFVNSKRHMGRLFPFFRHLEKRFLNRYIVWTRTRIMSFMRTKNNENEA